MWTTTVYKTIEYVIIGVFVNFMQATCIHKFLRLGDCFLVFVPSRFCLGFWQPSWIQELTNSCADTLFIQQKIWRNGQRILNPFIMSRIWSSGLRNNGHVLKPSSLSSLRTTERHAHYNILFNCPASLLNVAMLT